MLSSRGAYITLLKSKRTPSIEQTRQTYLGRNSTRKIKDKKITERSYDPKYRSNPKTDRQRTNILTNLNRQSTTKLETKLFRKDSKLKSSLNSWSKTCISLKDKNQSTHK